MKKTYTASFHNGGRKKNAKNTKGTSKSNLFQACREHNIRDPRYCLKQKHIDPDGVHEIWHDEEPRTAYKRIFGPSMEEYNSKQKRKDRIKKDYYEEIKKSTEKIPVYEAIITIGNAQNIPDNSEDVKRIYKEFVHDWNNRNPNMELIGVYYHADERRDVNPDGINGEHVTGVPHVHIDYIPVARGLERGMRVQNSLTLSLAQQGLHSMELDPTLIKKNSEFI